MKFPRLMILSMISFLLLLLPLLVVESSSVNATYITKGSSISTYGNISSWISPSSKMAFGFYASPHYSDQYQVGIYFTKSPKKTLVWTTNRCYSKPSLILLNSEGKLVLRSKSDNKEEPLIPGIQKPVSYGMMLDNGNFVLYGEGSEIVWQSFDHPTDTILGGQSLRSGVDLISNESKLSVQEINGAVAIYSAASDALVSSMGPPLPVILSLNLTTNGDLCLVGSGDAVLICLYRNKNQQQEEESIVKEGVYMYRATLDSTGRFSLYKDRIDGNISDHEESSILVQSWPVYHMSSFKKFLFGVLAIVCSGALMLCVSSCWFSCFFLFLGSVALLWLLVLLGI